MATLPHGTAGSVLQCRLGYPGLCLIALAPLVLWPKAVRVARRHVDDPLKLIPANGMTIAMHFFVGLLLTAGLVVSRWMTG